MKCKIISMLLINFALFMCLQSCVKEPYACFTTDVNEDSLSIGMPVQFSGLCSSNAAEYFWEFNNDPDSVEFTAYVSKVFSDTGLVHISLLVANGKKTSIVSRDVRVR